MGELVTQSQKAQQEIFWNWSWNCKVKLSNFLNSRQSSWKSEKQSSEESDIEKVLHLKIWWDKTTLLLLADTTMLISMLGLKLFLLYFPIY